MNKKGKQTMTERRFVYDPRLLSECAESDLAAFVASKNAAGAAGATSATAAAAAEHSPTIAAASGNSEKKGGGGGARSCIELFELQAAHYGRRHSPSEALVERRTVVVDGGGGGGAVNEEGPSSITAYRVGDRMEAFVRSVLHVCGHNSIKSDGDGDRHRVGLNRFSDMNIDEIFPPPATDDARRRLVGGGAGSSDSRGDEEEEEEEDWTFEDAENTWRKMLESGGVRGSPAEKAVAPVITPLTDKQAILDTAAAVNGDMDFLGIGHGSMNALKPKHYKKLYDHNKILEIPEEYGDAGSRFRPPEINDPELDGSILSIKRNKNLVSDEEEEEEEEGDGGEATGSPNNGVDGIVPGGEVQVSKKEEDEDVDPFATELNWATSNNPDGVPIVHEAFDQGTCGACWAFAAAGSLEASASRRAAHAAMKKYLKKHDSKKYSWLRKHGAGSGARAGRNSTAEAGSVEAASIAYAQQAELDSFAMLNLSVQELVDCDTAANEGCTGGNPLLSFYFIHRYGLASWSDYPYVGHEDECHEDIVKNPVASVRSWGVISPNHEKHMELVLRYIGPIAVGVNGGSRSFLGYTGGVFDDPTCKQGANHALLITGYGREVQDNGKFAKFWYARNSWGTGWGEGGFVRMKRGHGHKGEPGVCGIARSPSVALGGVLLKNDQQLDDDEMSLAALSTPQAERFCGTLDMGSNQSCLTAATWVSNHKALSAGLAGALLGLIVILLLAGDCRKRRRRNQLRAQKRAIEQERLKRSMLDQDDMAESSALLDTIQAQNAASYGTHGSLVH